jgi:hypothetical protein
MGYAYLSEIPFYPADVNLDLPGTWGSGALIYVEGDGYRYSDGTQWHRMGVGLEQLAHIERDTDLVVAGGATATLLQATITIDIQTEMLVRASIPMLELTNTSGGEARIYADVDGTPYDLGHVTSDRQFGWPLLVQRVIPVTKGALTVTLLIQSISNPLTAHAGSGMGETMMRIIA